MTHSPYSVDRCYASTRYEYHQYQIYAIKDTTIVLQHDTLEYIPREGTTKYQDVGLLMFRFVLVSSCRTKGLFFFFFFFL